METVIAQVVLIPQECGGCGGVFGLSESYRNECLKDRGPGGKHWHCPYCGERRRFIGKSTEERLREYLDAANARAARLDGLRKQAEHRERAQKAAKTRIKNRVAKGVCPCCNRSFENLRRHMETKHPDYAGAES